MTDILINDIEPAEDYNAATQANLNSDLPYILASGVISEFQKRCGNGMQYTTFPNQITAEEEAKLTAANYVVTHNTIASENRNGAPDLYIGFQVALNETAAANAMVISQKETNGISSGGGTPPTLIDKNISDNGTYNAADDGADGYSSVTVDVDGGVGFSKMGISSVISDNSQPLSQSILFVNNSSSNVDVSEIRGYQTILIINPIDELKVGALSNVGDGYAVSFIPTATCRVYEGDTELDLNSIFQSQQTPVGPTTYQPDGTEVHYLSGKKSPYDGEVRKLYDVGQRGIDFIIE